MTDDISTKARFAAGVRGAPLILTVAALLAFATLLFGGLSHAAPRPNAAAARPGDGPPPKPRKKRKARRPTARVTQTAPDCSNTNSGPNAADPPAAEANAVGVAECDEYITKYEACINGKIPENVRATVKESFDMTRKAWRDAATTPQGRARLAKACKMANEQARTALRSYGCCW